MNRKRVANMLALLMVTSLFAGCSNDAKESSPSSTETTVSSSQTETSEETVPTTTEPSPLETMTPEERYFQKTPEKIDVPCYVSQKMEIQSFDDSEDVCVLGSVLSDGYYYDLYYTFTENKPIRLIIDIYDMDANHVDRQIIPVSDTGLYFESVFAFEDGNLLITAYQGERDNQTENLFIFDTKTKQITLKNSFQMKEGEYFRQPVLYQDEKLYYPMRTYYHDEYGENSRERLACYDLKGNLLYISEGIPGHTSKNSDAISWFVLDGTLYGKSVMSTPGEYDLYTFDSKGKICEQKPISYDGWQHIYNEGTSLLMENAEGVWIFDEQWTVWRPVLKWETSGLKGEEGSDYYNAFYSEETGKVIYMMSVMTPDPAKTPSDYEEDRPIIVASGLDWGSDEFLYQWRYQVNDLAQDEIVSYRDYRSDEYGMERNAQDRLDALIQDFKLGKIDVLILDKVFQGDLNAPAMEKVWRLENGGYCLDLTPYMDPYEKGQKTWDFSIPLSIAQKMRTLGHQYVLPLTVCQDEYCWLHTKSGVSFKSDSNYASWLSYAENHTGSKDMVFATKTSFLKMCLFYDLWSFIDQNERKAHFECQEFQDLLDLMQYCDMPTVSNSGTNPYSKGLVVGIGYGTEGSQVGFPSRDGTYACVFPDMVIMVSSSCKNPEKAYEIVEELMQNCTFEWDPDETALVYWPELEAISFVMQESFAYLNGEKDFAQTAEDINARVNELLDAMG